MTAKKATRPKALNLRKLFSAGHINLDDWMLETFARMETVIGPIVAEAAAEAIEVALQDKDYTMLTWPAAWPGSAHDPLTLRLTISFSGGFRDDEEHDPFLNLDLREALAGYLEDCRDDRNDDSFWESLGRIRDALRALAQEIHEAITP